MLALLLSACGGKCEVDTVDSRTRLSMNACPVPIVDARAQCGTLTVPAQRSRPDSRLVQLPFVVLPARRADQASDLVLVLGGGPGSSVLLALASAPTDLLSQHPLRQRRDLIALDQRGTPLTGAGSLDCGELLRDDAAGERFVSEADLVSAASGCQARLSSQGVDHSPDALTRAFTQRLGRTPTERLAGRAGSGA